jgi:hypothetical protein
MSRDRRSTLVHTTVSPGCRLASISLATGRSTSTVAPLKPSSLQEIDGQDNLYAPERGQFYSCKSNY